MKKYKKIVVLILINFMIMGLVGCGKVTEKEIMECIENTDGWVEKEELAKIHEQIYEETMNFDFRIWSSNTVANKFEDNVIELEKSEYINKTIETFDKKIKDEKTNKDAKEALLTVAKNKYYINKVKELSEEVSKEIQIPVGNFSEPIIVNTFNEFKATDMYFFFREIGKNINEDNMFYDEVVNIINEELVKNFDNSEMMNIYIECSMGVLSDIKLVKDSVQVESIKIFNSEFILKLQELGIDEYRKLHDEIVEINCEIDKRNDLYVFSDLLKVLKNK